MIDIPVPFAKLDNSINTPAYAHEGDAGIDEAYRPKKGKNFLLLIL